MCSFNQQQHYSWVSPTEAFAGDSAVSSPWGSFLVLYVTHSIRHSPQRNVCSEIYLSQKLRSFLKQWVQKTWSPTLLQGLAFAQPSVKTLHHTRKKYHAGGVEVISIPFDWYPHASFYCAIVHLFSWSKTILCTLSNQSVMKMAQNCLSTAFLKEMINTIQHAFVCSRFLHNYVFVFLLILYMAFSCNCMQMEIILNWFSKSFILCEWWKFFIFVNYKIRYSGKSFVFFLVYFNWLQEYTFLFFRFFL